jgi:hypothetical protein
MADAFTTVTNLINSPPGQLVAGATLAGFVWKFFERVEAVLNDDTKLEIADWLKSTKLTPGFAERERHVGLLLFRAMWGKEDSKQRSIVGGLMWMVNALVSGGALTRTGPSFRGVLIAAGYMLYFMIFLIATTVTTEKRLRRSQNKALLSSLFLAVVTAIVGFLAVLAARATSLADAFADPRSISLLIRLTVVPALLVTMWMWLPVASGFLLRLARRLDIAVAWLNKRMDEKKAISTIGLVAGALVAMVYWAWAIVSRIV